MTNQLILGQTTFPADQYDLAAEAIALMPEHLEFPELWVKDALRHYPHLTEPQRVATKANLLRLGAPL